MSFCADQGLQGKNKDFVMTYKLDSKNIRDLFVLIKKRPATFFFSVIAIACLLLLISFQNCVWNAPFLDFNLDSNTNTLPLTSSIEDSISYVASIPVEQGELDPDCMDSSQYNACVFWKNPVAQNGKAIQPATTFNTDMSELQIYGVNILGMHSNYLQNSTYNVLIDWHGAERAEAVDQSWKFEYRSDAHRHVVQVMTYYWLMYQMSFMQERTGRWYAEHKNIQVVALGEDLKNDAYFSSAENKIAMGYFENVNRNDGQVEAGLSADIILHEAAHASFYYSNLNRTGTQNSTHRACSSTTCCTRPEGCFKAVNEGQADFHSVVIFESSPSIGEGVTNNIQRGLGVCMSRNLDVIKNRTMIEVYNGCGPGSDLSGEIHKVGTFYASIWWVIYTTIRVEKVEILRLFMEHLPLVSYDDTFETVGLKILNLDKQMFDGKYSGIIQRAFTSRGLRL